MFYAVNFIPYILYHMFYTVHFIPYDLYRMIHTVYRNRRIAHGRWRKEYCLKQNSMMCLNPLSTLRYLFISHFLSVCLYGDFLFSIFFIYHFIFVFIHVSSLFISIFLSFSFYLLLSFYLSIHPSYFFSFFFYSIFLCVLLVSLPFKLFHTIFIFLHFSISLLFNDLSRFILHYIAILIYLFISYNFDFFSSTGT